MTPRLLDLFCGAGGAAEGYARAGFEIVGVDIAPQPSYPYRFWHADALEIAREPWALSAFDVIHASPPCQAFTVYRNNRAHVRDDHPDLIAPVREALRAWGGPYVIENVPGAPLENPIVLCGTSFPPLEVRRHRLFESSVPLLAVPCNHARLTERKYPGSTNRPNGRTVANIGEWRVPLEEQRRAMDGCAWMSLAEIAQAVPPAFTEHLGRQLLEVISA